MPGLRAILNKGEHLIVKPHHRAPFTRQSVYDEFLGMERRARDDEYHFIKRLYVTPEFCNIIIMAFESALMNGGWRANHFIEWFNRNISEFPVELVQVIEGRLYPVMKKASGISMSEDSYRMWTQFCTLLRSYLYDI